MGKDLGFGWSLCWAEDALWRFSFFTEGNDLYRIDPQTGGHTRYRNDGQIMNPRGLTWDGSMFWVNDFSLLKIFGFTLEGGRIVIQTSFDIPEKDRGGTNGLAWDGEHLQIIELPGEGIIGPFVWADDGYDGHLQSLAASVSCPNMSAA